MGMEFDKELFKKEVKTNLLTIFRKDIEARTDISSSSICSEDHVLEQWFATQKKYQEDNPKIVYYLSMEFDGSFTTK